MQVIKAIGRSDVYLWLEIIKKTIEIVVLLLTMFISVNAIVIGMAAMTTAFIFVNAFPNSKLLNYSIKEQLSDILPSFVSSLVLFIVVYLLSYIPLDGVLLLLIQVISGVLLYVGISIFTKNKEYNYLKGSIKRFLLKR
jgi:hypothetical protein